MSLSSILLLPIRILNPPIPQSNPPTTLFSSPSPSPSSFRFGALTCYASQYDRDESLWLREEQRWLREEQRWLREEQRWARERDALLRRVTELELRIQAMDRRSSVQADDVPAEVTETIVGLVETLKGRALIAETGLGASPMVLEAKEKKKEKEKEKKKEDVVRDVAEQPKKEKNQTKKKRSSLRIGSEGEEVRALQEALQKLGFYSGEEDMEFSSFSSGTERAVKTWQASLGAREDGIMTEDLLAILFLEKVAEVQQKEGSNGAAVSKSNIQKEAANHEEVTQTRVFLLGENRWEEPSRLRGSRSKTTTPTKPTTKCIACRGEGRLLCTECDGTGEPNLEPQFMEWVDEGTKCPYCVGHGFTICDVCDGKPAL